MPTRDEIFDHARMAKAAFWGASEIVLRMHARGQIDAERAISMIRDAFDVSHPLVKEGEKALKQFMSEFQFNKESPSIDDVPPL